MKGMMQVPDDFDRMGGDDMERFFVTSDKIVAKYPGSIRLV